MDNLGPGVPNHALRQEMRPALLLAGISFLLLLLTAPHIGLTWDEPTYIVAAEIYPDWLGQLLRNPAAALSGECIAQHWEFNCEHPPLSKLWSGLIWSGARHVLDDLTAHRLGNMLLSALLIGMLYHMLAAEKGRRTGLVAAAALLTMPRFFFHAHLAALDVPVTVMIFATVYAFWLGRHHQGFGWTLLLGGIWGLALTTKINALFIPPIVLVTWVILFERRRALVVRLILAGLIGAAVFFISWPWLYQDTFSRLTDYLRFLTINRYPTEQYYFGQLHTSSVSPLPWHFPLVMIFLVVPFTLFCLAVLGAFVSLRSSRDRPLAGLLLPGALVSLLVVAGGQAFDNERLLMPAFPFVAALAGLGFTRLVSVIQRMALQNHRIRSPSRVVTAVTVLVFAPHLLMAGTLYPHLLSYYSEAVGGAYGARWLQMETTYWCDLYADTLDFLNSTPQQGAVIWADCQDVLIYYQLHGKLRTDLLIANGPEATTAFDGVQLHRATFAEADYVVYQYRQSGYSRALGEWLSSREPVYTLHYGRLRLAEIYTQ